MNAKETRKKIQRTLVMLADQYPERIVQRELLLIQQTLDGLLKKPEAVVDEQTDTGYEA